MAAALVIASFFMLHTGARADALCLREAFVEGGELSLWPPGARCSFGEPAREGVVLHPAFVGIALLVVVAAVVAWWKPRNAVRFGP